MKTGQIISYSQNLIDGTKLLISKRITGVIKNEKGEFYTVINIETKERGVALKSIYDKIFHVEKKPFESFRYKGENPNYKIRMSINDKKNEKRKI